MTAKWTITRLGQVATINPDAIGRDWLYPHIRYIDISSVGVGQIEVPPQWMKVSDAPSRAKRLVRKGDTVLSTVRPNRRSMFFASQPADDWVVSTGFAVLRPKTQLVDPRFFYACVFNQAFTEYLITREKGAAYPAVSSEDIAKAEIPLPPLREQRAIACILGTLDDKIELNRRMNETLEDMAQAIFKSWFVDFDPVRAKAEGQKPPSLARHIADLFPDALEDSELGEIPKGWKVGKFGDCCAVKGGYAYKSKDFVTIGHPLVRIKNIATDRTVDLFDVVYLPKSLALETKTFWLSNGDLVMAMTGATIGKYGLIVNRDDAPDALLNQRVAKIALKFDSLSSSWFPFVTLLATDIYDQVVSIGGGSAQPNISCGQIEDCRLIVPTFDLISCFSNIVEPLIHKLINNTGQARTIAALRDTLLPKLISGKLRVPDAERIVERCI